MCGALIVLSCSLPAGNATFTKPDGTQSILRISRVDGHRHHHLAPAEGIISTGVLHLRESVKVTANQAFFLQYRSTVSEVTVSLLSSRDHEVASQRLVASGPAPVRIQISLSNGNLWGFRLWTDKEDGRLDVIAAGIEPSRSGMETIDGMLHVGTDVILPRGTQADTMGLKSLVARLTTSRKTPQVGSGLIVRSSFTPDTDGHTGELLLSVSGGADGRYAIARGMLVPGERLVYLHETILNFVPTEIQTLSYTGGDLRFLELRRFLLDAVPLPADLQTILDYPQDLWRKPDWEVFRWSAFGKVLIFDTASYRIQESLFRRLAYFTEKAGFRGRVLNDDELGNRYGYNAHDYAAADLARFFTKATRDRIQLNDSELWLRDFLAAEGIIRAAGVAWEAGSGAVLSISRESSPGLRKILLSHEAAHGLYFINAIYRQKISELWNRISEQARTAWRVYLAVLAYDVTSDQLTMNEFQAYLAQQQESALRYYFGVLVPNKIRRISPTELAAASWFEEGIREIRSQHQAIEHALQFVTGSHAGSLTTVFLTR